MAKSSALDKFYTLDATADRLIDVACEQLKLDRGTQEFLEPSAGGGAFSRQLSNVHAYDLAPESDGIEQADFLELEPSWDKSCVAIGNPPFGYKAKLATAFVNNAAESCDAVCFILPNTFHRYNTQSKVDAGLALVYDETLPEASFSFEGEPYSLKCIFQIWVRKGGAYDKGQENLRMTSRPPISHPDFDCWQHNATVESRKYLDEDWEMAFWRQGYKDYSETFRKDADYDKVRSIMYDTNLQLFLVKPHTDEARGIIESLDLNNLASENLATPGFGKADFVRAYVQEKESRHAQNGK